MQTTHNTILITGGGSGIGLALAAAFYHLGNTVIICGRRDDKLRAAQALLPGVHTRICDVADAHQREELAEWAKQQFPALNVLVNNAGIQRELHFGNGTVPPDVAREISTNLTAPLHLTALLVPHLLRQPEAAILNITSGLGFIPMAAMPVYCATKAALHSLSNSLRHQLRTTTVKVFEIAPPIVDTDLDAGARDGRGQQDRGIPAEDVATATVQALAANEYTAVIGMARGLYDASRSEKADFVFGRLNQEN